MRSIRLFVPGALALALLGACQPAPPPAPTPSQAFAAPLQPVGGIRLALPGYAPAFPFASVRDEEDSIARLQAIRTLLGQVVALSRAGARDGLVQPKCPLERIPARLREIAAPVGADSPFALPLKRFPDAVPAAERARRRDFFHAHPSDDQPGIQAETDRYIVWPGRALGYKLGELDILVLREKAKRELGPRLDLRAFHDRIRGGGAMRLDLLDARIAAWIAQAKAGPSTTPEKPR
ncbi:DUF885 family protein [Xanthomonas theicola]|nr:DUF885 family protein [Xanthomonas theicola]